MPLPKGVRYRFKQTSPRTRVRLAFLGRKVVEVVPYRKRNGQWVRGHVRRIRK